MIRIVTWLLLAMMTVLGWSTCTQDANVTSTQQPFVGLGLNVSAILDGQPGLQQSATVHVTITFKPWLAASLKSAALDSIMLKPVFAVQQDFHDVADAFLPKGSDILQPEMIRIGDTGRFEISITPLRNGRFDLVFGVGPDNLKGLDSLKREQLGLAYGFTSITYCVEEDRGYICPSDSSRH
jgi:hypothetical protein